MLSVTRFFTTAGAASDLNDGPESALIGTEIREVHGIVDVDDPDQGDVREIEPLRDHLRADQNINLLLGECLQ